MSGISRNINREILNSDDILETLKKQKAEIDFELEEADEECKGCTYKYDGGKCMTCWNNYKIMELFYLLEEVITLKDELEK